MRTTLTLDPDVAAGTRKAAASLGKSMKETINSALRIGLDHILKPAPAKPYHSATTPMGLNAGYNYDNVSELLAVAEGEDHR